MAGGVGARALPVVRDGSETRFAYAGEPVWPVRNDEDLRALEELAMVCGATLTHVPAQPAHLEPGQELVVALGTGVAPAAALYAHLTGRSWRSIEHLEQIGSDLPAVVVTTTGYLSDALLERLYGCEGQPTVPGLLYADSADELHRQVLIRSAAAHLGGEGGLRRVDLLPGLDRGRIEGPAGLIFGGGAEDAELLGVLGGGANLLAALSHSDGIDAALSANLILCPLAGTEPVGPAEFAPRCLSTGTCHRLGVPVAEALASGRLVAVDALAARVLLWLVCWGVLLPGGAVDPRWSLGRKLIASARIGALVTPWDTLYADRWYLEALARLLLCGDTLGEALARFNALPEARQAGCRLCLLGDPSIRLAPVPRSVALPRRAPQQVPECGELTLLRACLLADRGDGPASAPAEAALQAIHAFERSAWTGHGLPDAGPRLRRSVLAYLASQKYLVHHWLGFAEVYRTERPTHPCTGCGRPTKTSLARVHLPGVRERRLVVCPGCGLVEDAPAHFAGEIHLLDARTLGLSAALPAGRWVAAVQARSQLASDSRVWDWPADGDGNPAPTFCAPTPWPGGPLRLSVLLVWEQSYAILSMAMPLPAQVFKERTNCP